ncbi:MAG: rRNA pseudouridine synthase, partial [Peptococcaceae bacterium]|nr:rRNA pseudouridine synthase [Peptococcaceae bacterium]
APQDKIEILGRGKIKQAGKREELVYYLLYKPVGVITSVYDPQHRKTVIDLIRHSVSQRVYPVGRLDYDTSGLLLLTNDGDLTYRLTHPRYKVQKTYKAWVKGPISTQALKTLQEGVRLEDGITAPAKIIKVQQANRGNNLSTVEISIHEGRNRQVRRMFEAVGYPLVALQRIAFGPLKLDNLKPGEFRPLEPQEIKLLRKEAGLDANEWGD